MSSLLAGTNHLGHFLLANMMLEDLQNSQSKSRRLIIVGSITGNTNTLAGNVLPKVRATSRTLLAYAATKCVALHTARQKFPITHLLLH